MNCSIGYNIYIYDTFRIKIIIYSKYIKCGYFVCLFVQQQLPIVNMTRKIKRTIFVYIITLKSLLKFIPRCLNVNLMLINKIIYVNLKLSL